MEDLILVTGCTLAKSWAAAVFDGTMSKDDNAATISLEARTSDGGKAQFVWRNICGSVEFHHTDSVCSLAYFFPRRELINDFIHHTRILKDPRISASSSGASEQNVVSFGPNTSGLHESRVAGPQGTRYAEGDKRTSRWCKGRE